VIFVPWVRPSPRSEPSKMPEQEVQSYKDLHQAIEVIPLLPHHPQRYQTQGDRAGQFSGPWTGLRFLLCALRRRVSSAAAAALQPPQQEPPCPSVALPLLPPPATTVAKARGGEGEGEGEGKGKNNSSSNNNRANNTPVWPSFYNP
jgi:hypothetical protein